MGEKRDSMSYTNNSIITISTILGMDTNAVQAELNILHELINSADRGCGHGIFNGLTLEETINALYEVTVLPRPIAGGRSFTLSAEGKRVLSSLTFSSPLFGTRDA